MKKLISFLIAGLLAGAVGCQEQKSKANDKLSQRAHSTSSGQAELKLNSIVKFLRSDGSWYLTEQKHEIFVEPEAIRITDKEPYGKIVVTFQNDKLALNKSLKAESFDKDFYNLITEKSICSGLLELYLAESKSYPADSNQATEFSYEGRIYELISNKNAELYQNKSTQQKELVISGNKTRYLLYGYNYLKSKQGRYFPSKIDIYLYNDSSKELIAQYESHLL